MLHPYRLIFHYLIGVIPIEPIPDLDSSDDIESIVISNPYHTHTNDNNGITILVTLYRAGMAKQWQWDNKSGWVFYGLWDYGIEIMY